MLELGVGRQLVLGGRLGDLGRRNTPAELVERDAACDRVRPGAQVLAVLQPGVRPQRAQERLLERVLGPFAPEPAAQEREYLVPVRLVEPLERRNRHGIHLPF